ncbi:unnamed protein product [Parajaminaea phylloscopi]
MTAAGPSLVDAVAAQSSGPLKYSIAAVSSWSNAYEPWNVLTDRPLDLSSRWSGASFATASPTSAAHPSGSSRPESRSALVQPQGPSNGKQYIILKLEQPALVKSILFGKFHKAHPCNLKDFKVYGGPEPDPNSSLWMRLLRAGLRNDAVSEEFDLRWVDRDGLPSPIRYVKVVPLAAHSANYNFSVWHIALKGIIDPTIVGRASYEREDNQENTTARLILKHLRSRGHHEAFEALLKSSNLGAPPLEHCQGMDALASSTDRLSQRPFEHPLVTQLFQAIMSGDWDAAENCLEKCAAESTSDPFMKSHHGLFASYVSQCVQKAQWTRINATDADGDIPSPRGGHQLVVDSVRGTAYLFGGWDGYRDLSDFWVYDIASTRWRRISSDTSQQGGPGPRSCHKLAYSSRSGLIYVLGRYVEYQKSQSSHTSSDPDAQGSAQAGANSAPWLPSRSSQRLASSSRVDGPGTEVATSVFEQGVGAVPSEVRNPTHSQTSTTSASGPRATTAPASSSPPTPTASNYCSDFYRFSTRSERWDRLSSDTAADGGPKLIFDHQMVVDDEAQILYVFGGRVAHWNPAHLELSGMWRYDCIQRVWSFDFDDDTNTDKILSRVGHSMLLDVGCPGERRRQLWILAGQRGDSYLADMYTYDLTTRKVKEVAHDYSRGGKGPMRGFTQRSAIDPTKGEIYLFSGSTKSTDNSAVKMASGFWLYRIERDEWRLVWQGQASGIRSGQDEEGVIRQISRGQDQLSSDEDEVAEASSQDHEAEVPARGESSDDDMSGTPQGALPAPSHRPRQRSKRQEREPRPRYASEFGYEPKSETFLLFGGNPSDPKATSARLDDLWYLKLLRPSVQEVLRRAKFTLRQQRFREMAASVPRPPVLGQDHGSADGGLAAMEALLYLQTKVSEVVDHGAPEESRAFRKLVAGLLRGDGEGDLQERRPPPFVRTAVMQPGTVPRRGGTDSPRVESDGLPAMDDDADMLSVSQTLPQAPPSGASSSDTGRNPHMDTSSGLFARRLRLFRQLLQYFPPDAIEPAEDLGLAIASSSIRAGNRR